MKKFVLISAGCASLALGVAGIFVPVLPTTPFLILAAACFLRSSGRLYAWLAGHRILGPYIRNYLRHKAISARAKAVSVAILWIVILCSAFFFVHSLWVRIVLVVIAGGVSIYLLRMRTLTKEMAAEQADKPDRS